MTKAASLKYQDRIADPKDEGRTLTVWTVEHLGRQVWVDAITDRGRTVTRKFADHQEVEVR